MAVTTNFLFTKLVGTDYAGYSTINTLIDSIDSILNARIPASATAASVIGRSAATAGATAAIAATSDGQVLRRASSIVGFGTIPQSSISDFVFTTEAARDAAITSPTEGMRAYITASTVAAATGGITAVPTGIQTIYNGSGWVCVTDVCAFTADGGTRSGASYAALTGGGTAPTVTLTTGTTAYVSFGSLVETSAIIEARMGVSINAAGAVSPLVSAYIAGTSATSYGNTAKTICVTGLTAGTNTFGLQYYTSSGTGIYSARYINVRGIA